MAKDTVIFGWSNDDVPNRYGGVTNYLMWSLSVAVGEGARENIGDPSEVARPRVGKGKSLDTKSFFYFSGLKLIPPLFSSIHPSLSLSLCVLGKVSQNIFAFNQ